MRGQLQLNRSSLLLCKVKASCQYTLTLPCFCSTADVACNAEAVPWNGYSWASSPCCSKWEKCQFLNQEYLDFSTVSSEWLQHSMLDSSALWERAIRGKNSSPHQMHAVRMLNLLWRSLQPLKPLSGLMKASPASSHHFNPSVSSHSQSVAASAVSHPTTPSSCATTHLHMLNMSLSKSSWVSEVSTAILV